MRTILATRSTRKKTAPFVAGLLVAVFSLASMAFGVAGYVGVGTPTASAEAANCAATNILHCGLSGSGVGGYIDSLQAAYNRGSDTDPYRTPATYNDLKTVYNWSGASAGSIAGMNSSNTKVGTMNKAGDITVGGTTVGHDAWVTARFTNGSGFTQISSGAWARKTTTYLQENTAPVIVHFNASGAADFAVMIDCGNAVKFTATPPPPPPPPPAPKPALSCTSLTAKEVGTTSQFGFSALAKASNTTITKYVFTYGDGQNATVTTGALSASANHTYDSSGGAYTAKVTVYSNNFTGGVTAASCAVTVHVTPPYCKGLTGAFLDTAKTNVQFTATGVLNGTTLTTADFDYGDGTAKTGVAKTTDTTVVIAHTYAKGGTYNASATLHFTGANSKGITAVTCKAVVTPSTVTPECKPGIPVGDTRCNPCATNPSVTADDTVNCVVPVTTLPNTGAGNTIAIFSVVVIGGFLGYRQILFRKHKAAFMAAQYGTSPLPLADPIDDSAPLAGTPLAPKKRGSLRRKRPF